MQGSSLPIIRAEGSLDGPLGSGYDAMLEASCPQNKVTMHPHPSIPSTWQLAVLCRVTPSCGVLIDAVHFLLCTARDLDDASMHTSTYARTLCQGGRPSNYCAICQPQANLSQIRLVDAASLSANKTDDSASC